MAPKNFGSIRELPSGNFQARYRPNDGDPMVMTFGTRAEAQEFLDVLRGLAETERVTAEKLDALARRR